MTYTNWLPNISYSTAIPTSWGNFVLHCFKITTPVRTIWCNNFRYLAYSTALYRILWLSEFAKYMSDVLHPYWETVAITRTKSRYQV